MPPFSYQLYFKTWTEPSSQSNLTNFLANKLQPDTIVCMVLFYSGERYYKSAIPYLEELVGQPITSDLEYGESWALLGYKGTHSPVPYWRENVRRKIGQGPSEITTLVTLRKGQLIGSSIGYLFEAVVLIVSLKNWPKNHLLV